VTGWLLLQKRQHLNPGLCSRCRSHRIFKVDADQVGPATAGLDKAIRPVARHEQ
jgi:hypothetical protein